MDKDQTFYKNIFDVDRRVIVLLFCLAGSPWEKSGVRYIQADLHAQDVGWYASWSKPYQVREAFLYELMCVHICIVLCNCIVC